MKRRSFLKTTLGAGLLATIPELPNCSGQSTEAASRSADIGTTPLSGDPFAYGWKAGLSSISIGIGESRDLIAHGDYVPAPGEIVSFSFAQGASEMAAVGITLSNGILTHDGRANEGASIPLVQLESNVPQQATNLVYDGHVRAIYKGGYVNFGKHWSWAGPFTDGKWYNFGGDGGYSSSSSSAARWMRWDPTTETIDFYYPQYGVAGRPHPNGPDCYIFILRSNNTFVALPGYLGGRPSAKEVGVPIGGGAPTLNGQRPRFDYTPGTPYGSWSYRTDAANWPIGENNSNRNYDPATDRAFMLRADNALYVWDLAANTVTHHAAVITMADFTGSQQQVYCSETNEMFALALKDNYSDKYKANLTVVAVNVDTRVCRVLWEWDRPPQQSVATGVAGMTPVVLVPNRRKLYIFTWEYLDAPFYYNQNPVVQPWTEANTGGIIEISFKPGYTNPTWKVMPYPKALRAYCSTLNWGNKWAGDVIVNNAYYDPLRDTIWGTAAGAYAIFTMRWA